MAKLFSVQQRKSMSRAVLFVVFLELTSQHYPSYTHTAFDKTNNNYKVADPQYPNYYLCQHSDSSCSSVKVINVTKGCVIPSDDDQRWFNARNQCLRNGSDLAILTDDDLDVLKRSNVLNAGRSYWIGLRINTWIWELQGTVSGETTSSASSKMTTSTPIVSSTTSRPPSISNTLLSTTTHEILNTIESAAKNATDAESHVLLYSGVGAGIAFIIICIIVIIVVAKRTRRSDKDKNQTKIKNKSEQNRPDLSPDLSPNKPASSTDTAQVTGADDPRAVYAEISPATLNQPELKSNTEQPGIVYASLDFQKEPTSLELDKKSAHATENPPIYAN